jgi:hypothetical protein
MNGVFDVRALYDALDAERRSRAIGWNAAAREMSAPFSGLASHPISASTLRGMCGRQTIEADGVLQMLLWLDRTPESFVPGHALANSPTAKLRRVETGRILRFDARALHAALDARRRELGFTWAQVAGEIGGLPAANLTRLARGGRVGFPHVMRVLAWLGRPAAEFTHDATG